MGALFPAGDDDEHMERPRVRGGLGRAVSVVLLAVALAVGGLVVGLALVAAAAALLAVLDVELSTGGRIVLSVVLLQGVAFGGTAAAYLRFRGLGFEYLGVSVPDARDLLWVVSGYVLALAGALAVGAAAVLAGLQPARNRLAELGQSQPEVFLLLVPASVLLVGPGEELLFRGLVQGSLREVFGPVAAIGLASALFALAHVTSLTGDPAGRLVTVGLLFVPAIVLGVAYEATGNVVVPAAVHGAYNATLFALAYASSVVGPPGLV